MIICCQFTVYCSIKYGDEMRFMRPRFGQGRFPLSLQYKKHQTAIHQSADEKDRRQEIARLHEMPEDDGESEIGGCSFNFD